MKADKQRSGGRLENIDAVRGVAAVLVMFRHILTNPVVLGSSAMASTAILALCLHYFDVGKFGVMMFFAVSGYVIPFSFKGARPTERFAISRFFRLYPAYWLSIALAVPLLAALGKPVGIAPLLANLTMAQRLFGQPDVLGVFWTLFVELVFYGLCAAACALGVLKKPGFVVLSLVGWTILLVLAAAAIHVTGKKLPVAPVFGLGVMYLGSLIRLAQIERDATAIRMMPVGMAIVVVGQIAACWFAYANVSDPDVARWNAQALATVVAITGFVIASRYHGRVAPAAIFFGAISYALYLVHEMVIMALAPGFRGAGPFGAVLFSVLAAAGAALLSWLVFRFVEQPCIAKGHAVARAREGRREVFPAR